MALIQSWAKQQESFPWLQWVGDLALMLSLKNTQKLLFWQHEVIVSFSCRSAPAHQANKAERTSCSSQPEMHFREAFARAFSNKRNTRETNVITIFSNTKLRVINTYSWLKKKYPRARKSVSVWTYNEYRNRRAATSHTIEAEMLFWGCWGARKHSRFIVAREREGDAAEAKR